MSTTTNAKIDAMINQMEQGGPQTEWRSLLETVLEGMLTDIIQAMTWTVRQRWGGPDAAAHNSGATQKDLNTIDTDFAMTNVVNPDYPRNVVLKGHIDGATIGCVATFTGTDVHGDAQTEVLTAVHDTTVAGVKAFATVSGISVAVTGTGGVADVLDAGFGLLFGLLGDVDADCMVKMDMDGDDVGEGDVTIATTHNTITFETAPNATRVFEAWYGARG